MLLNLRGMMVGKRRLVMSVTAGALLLIILCLALIPTRIALARKRQPIPQAILVLSGDSARVTYAADYARTRPVLEIWYTTGFEFSMDWKPFTEAGIARERVHLDPRAQDTVTNFTTLAGDFKRMGFQNIGLITSDYHMRRARMIAAIVLGSQGIAVTPLPVPSNRNPESMGHALRDVVRSLVWLATGHTGATIRRK